MRGGILQSNMAFRALHEFCMKVAIACSFCGNCKFSIFVVKDQFTLKTPCFIGGFKVEDRELESLTSCMPCRSELYHSR